MPYAIEPLVAGELGPDTDLDSTTHPPVVRSLEYVLDAPVDDDLIESFPVFLVSDELAEQLLSAELRGFELADATVRPSLEYSEAYGDAPHKPYRWFRLTDGAPADCWRDDEFRLCVSDRMMAVLERANLSGALVEPLPSTGE